MTNVEIAKLLRNVAAAYSIQNESKYRFQIIAYQRAADSIESSITEVKDLVKEDKLAGFPGVGPSIQRHLEDLIKTGTVKHFDSVMKEIPPAVFTLMRVPTFGPKKAYKLTKEFNITAKDPIGQVFKLAQEGKINKLEGFGEKSEKDMIRAIEEYHKGYGKTTRMALPYAGEIAETITKYLKKSKDVVDVQPLGSLRRMKETIGDIDFGVSTSHPEKAIDYFLEYPQKERTIEKGPVSASLITTGGTQIDLIALEPSRFGSLLQHFTGSKNHNVHLRELALKKGLSLSERGIKHKGNEKKIEAFDSEEKFYKALGLEWIPPEMREDTGEIELAAKHALPKIVELSDMKGDLHVHSNYPIEPSHDLGQDTMETMLKRAVELKYDYLGFSEHNPSVSKHTASQIYSILEKRKEKIELLKRSNKNIRILNLLELDILANGNLAIDDKSLSLFDAVLVSIHSSFSMNKTDMTKRILAGLAHPKAKIFSHPTGRLINERPGYEVDFEKLFEFCKKHNKALEINAWPTRLDLGDSNIRRAVTYGVKMVIDTDSHALWQMDLMKYGVAQARRGWATKSDILNTLPYNKFIEWIKS